jgi:DNA repair exonuclease SbcCD ATPase subunit
MKKTIVSLVIAVFIGSMMLMACAGGDKGPAELAIKAAEEAVNATKTEAAKIVPDQVKSLETALTAAKDKFAKGEYKAAVDEAKALAGKAKEILAAAKAKKEELTKQWTDLSQAVPKMMESLQSRVDILSKAKKLPANLTAEKFAEVKSVLASAKDEWAKAQESFKAGNFADSVSVAASLKEKATKAMETLGMTVPAAAKS